MALTLIAATAASTDTGWTQLYSTEWTNPTLTLTQTGTGRAYVEIRGKRTGGDTPLFAGEVSWAASGSQAIQLPTFAGKVRVSVRILSTSGSIAVSISDPTSGSSYDPATGNTVFGGAVVAPEHLTADPRSGRLVSADPRPALEAGLGVGLFCGIWGSSSDRRCATNDVNLLTETSSTNGTNEYCDGWWRHMQTRFGTQFSLCWNGAVAGDLWAATAAKITSDLAGGNVPHLNFAFVRPGTNDIAAGATAASISASIQATIEGQFLARGIKVILITSHTSNPLGSATLAEYRNLAAFLDSLVALYPGLIMHANTFAAFGEDVTPSADMLDSQHLNEDGTEIAASAFENVARVFGNPCASLDPWDYGEVVMEIDPNNTASLTVSSATLAAGTADSDKKKRLLLTCTANGGRLIQANLIAGKTLADGDLCRIWCDVEPSAGGSTSNIYMPGISFRNSAATTDSKHFGARASGTTYDSQVGNRIRGLSRIFRIGASMTTGQLMATAGAGTNAALVGRCALIRVKRAGA